MKKFKLLICLSSIATIGTVFVPLTSCGTKTNMCIPYDCLEIEGNILKGLKKDVDISMYNTLSIPNSIKIIDTNAFNDVFVTGTKEGKINKIIIPSTIREIRNGAFADCSSIRTLDLSSWNVKEIDNCKIAQEIISETTLGSFTRWTYAGNVIFNNDLSYGSRYELGKKLSKAGLWINWCIDETKGKIVADELLKQQSAKVGYAKYQFHLLDKLPANGVLYATVTKTRGTENVGVTDYRWLSKESQILVPDENNNVLLPITLFNHLNPSDFAEFNVSFVSAIPDSATEYKPLWKETITGFRLVNSTRVATSIKAVLEKSEINVGKTTTVTSLVSPMEAEDKTVTYYSLDPSIAKVDDHGIVTGVSEGKTKIVVKANGGLLLFKELDITVKN